jgi:hypothetical protein
MQVFQPKPKRPPAVIPVSAAAIAAAKPVDAFNLIITNIKSVPLNRQMNPYTFQDALSAIETLGARIAALETPAGSSPAK